MTKAKKNSFFGNLKSILIAIFIALLIRSFIFEPFNIPSGSMKPNLLVGDFIFVSKYSYGFSKHSLPFSIPLIPGKIFSNTPERGDVVVFKTPADNRTDYIKRLIGLPGDQIQFIDSNLFINNSEILKSKISETDTIYCGSKIIKVLTFEEKLPNGKLYKTVYLINFTFKNSDIYTVPEQHYFFLGDNRDCSKDSRFLTSVGYVHKNNLVGKARFIFFSSDISVGSIFEFWKWNKSIRFKRFFKKII